MIEVGRYEDVIQIRMTSEVDDARHYWVSVYLVDGLLIDTGCARTAEELVRFLESQRIHLVVNTHHHEDHVGGNHLIQERFRVDIYAHPDALPSIEEPPDLPLYREARWGQPEPSKAFPLPKTIQTSHFRFDLIETPGHCPGHVALVEKSRGWCFTGDLFVGKPKAAGPETDVTDMVRSMKTLLQVDSRELTLFTSMRNVERDGRAALQSSIDYLANLSGRAKELRSQGHTVTSIVEDLFEGEIIFDGITDGQYSSANLVRLLLKADL